MKKVKISQFGNGISQSETNYNTSFNSKSGGFDIYTDLGKLIPYPEKVEQKLGSDSISDYEISDVLKCSYGNVGFGYTSSISTTVSLFLESATESVWNKQGTGSNVYLKNGGFIYNNLPVILTRGGSGPTHRLERFDTPSTSSIVATVNANYNPTNICKPLVHPLDDIAYFPIGNTVFYYDRVTGTSGVGIELPRDREITSIAPYSGYLAIATISNTGNSIVYLWGRDRTLNTLQEQIDFGEGDLMVIENIGNILYGVSQETSSGYKTTIRAYAGGSSEIVKEIETEGNLLNLKQKVGNILYFSVRNSDTLYSFFKNKNGSFTMVKDYFISNGEEAQTVGGFSFIGDRLFTNFSDSSDYKMYATPSANTISSNVSYYETTQNPGIDADDIAKNKNLKRVYVLYKNKKLAGIPCNIKVSYSVNGGDYVELINESGNSGVFVKEQLKENTGDDLSNFLEVKFRIETSYNVEVLEFGYHYDVFTTTI